MGKAFEKQTKTIEDQEEKQVNALPPLKPKEVKPEEIKPKDTKPVDYGDYFLKMLDKIQKNIQSVDFNDLTYNFI